MSEYYEELAQLPMCTKTNSAPPDLGHMYQHSADNTCIINGNIAECVICGFSMEVSPEEVEMVSSDFDGIGSFEDDLKGLN